jgi:hypothetical protein
MAWLRLAEINGETTFCDGVKMTWGREKYVLERL